MEPEPSTWSWTNFAIGYFATLAAWVFSLLLLEWRAIRRHREELERMRLEHANELEKMKRSR
jgi:hypothetical protein